MKYSDETVSDFLNSLGLEGHYLCDSKNIEDIVALEPNWEKVDQLLNQQREISINFLETALKP